MLYEVINLIFKTCKAKRQGKPRSGQSGARVKLESGGWEIEPFSLYALIDYTKWGLTENRPFYKLI